MVADAARSPNDPSDTVPDLPRADSSRTTMDVLDSELLPNETSGKRVRPDATVKGIGPSEANVVYTLKPQRAPERARAEAQLRVDDAEDEHFTWLEKDKGFVRTISASALGLVACMLLILFSGGAHDQARTGEASAPTPEVQAAPVVEPPVVAAPAVPASEPVAKAAPFPEVEQAAPASKVVAKKKTRTKGVTRAGTRAKTNRAKAARVKAGQRTHNRVSESSLR